jgi:hypothetical protein
VTIIQKDGDGLPRPRGGEDQVYRVVSVDIAGFDYQSTRRGHQANRLFPDGGQLQLNPVTTGIIQFRLDTGQIGTNVAVEVGNCKLRSGSQ